LALTREKIAEGNKITVWEIVKNQTSEFRELVSKLSTKEKNVLLAKITTIADHGPLRNEEKFRHEGEGIYAIKQNQIRVYCFFEQDRMIVLTHGFIKKSKKVDPKQLSKAIRIREEYYVQYRTTSNGSDRQIGG
jgi:phage-related protein